MQSVQRPAYDATLVLVTSREQEQSLAFGEYLDNDLLDNLLAVNDLPDKLLLLARNLENGVCELFVLVPRLS